MKPKKWYKVSNLEKPINSRVRNHQLELREFVARKLKIPKEEIQELKLLRESFDARKKNRLKFIYTVAIRISSSINILKHSSVSEYLPPQPPPIQPFIHFEEKPIIIGAGPAGLFAALVLVEKGYQPIIIERGKPVPERSKDIENLWHNRILNENSNVQFGEGGAGTFSDGKLTARNQNFFSCQVLQTLVRFGAPPEILYQQKPHIGTDKLREIIPRLRQYLLDQAVKFHFNSRLDDIQIQDNRIVAAKINGQSVACRNIILAIGHSARETYQMLADRKVKLTAKAFAVGVRAEHPRSFIDQSQYGKQCNFQITGAADYKLTYNWKAGGRGIYSFCMCPGGDIVLSSSCSSEIVTNGMSRFARNSKFSNSGIVVTIHPNDFLGGRSLSEAGFHPIEFQQKIESKAFKFGGENYNAPAQMIQDFMKNRVSTKLKKSSYLPGLTAAPINKILPNFIIEALQHGFRAFNQKIPGYINEGLLVAPETRTSSPVRILRDELSFESVTVKGLFVVGEGAGYAGGIVSSAADALKLVYRIKTGQFS